MSVKSFYLSLSLIALATSAAGCAGHGAGPALPTAPPALEQSIGRTTPAFTEYFAGTQGVTGGIALGYDGGVWFTQNNSDVTRFLNGTFSRAHIDLNDINLIQIPAFPLLTATANGVYTGVELDEEAGFGVEEHIVQVTYARHVAETGGVAFSFVNGSMNAIASAGNAVYATGSYDELGAPPQQPGCTSCLYLVSDSGKSKYLTRSLEISRALAPLGNALYVAAAETDLSRNTLSVRFYRVTPSTFAFQHIATLYSPSNVLGVTAGPDNALWFTDAGRNAIGRLDALGHITEFPLPTAHAKPNQITGAGDGALWFTETAADKIGRITTSGGITEYHVPTVNAAPVGISAVPLPACGPRALWFAETSSGKIARLTY
jgi:streptogramin lyase